MIARSGLRSAFTPSATILQRVDVEARVGLVEDRERRLEHRHLEDLVALLLAAGEALVDRAAAASPGPCRAASPSRCTSCRNSIGVELRLAAVLAHRVERRLEEVGVGDAGDLDRILERQEDALAGALLGLPSSSRSLPS